MSFWQDWFQSEFARNLKRRPIFWGSLAALIGAVFAFSLLRDLRNVFFRQEWVLAGAAYSFVGLSSTFQRWVNAMLSRHSAAPKIESKEDWGRFSVDLMAAENLQQVIQVLKRWVMDTVAPVSSSVYVVDPQDLEYFTESREAVPVLSLPKEGQKSALISYLSSHKELLRLKAETLPEEIKADLQDPALLDAEVLFPIPGRDQISGWLALGPRKDHRPYTNAQFSLVQSLSNQAALAVDRIRTIAEMERRSRQMSILSEVTRQLTSTLDFEPLLQLILESAVDILHCEAGSLLLVDDTANELVFRSVVGPVAADLLHRRMPADRGVAGKAMKTGQPIIVNDVSLFPEWFSQNDQQTGFVTREMLVQPMRLKDAVIGVIEVINKSDGAAFIQEDLDLLSAFAAQAAVAFENAMLYTHTDMALSARVQELSIMQRIDRELNASLDPFTTAWITLEWALRQSEANAGLLGVLEEGEAPVIRILASRGYTDELTPYGGLLPLQIYHLEDAVLGGLPAYRWLEGDEKIQPLLTGAKTQAILPIRQEVKTIGLLLLESTGDELLVYEIMNFLTRLSDHASIAISNAQLYTAVQQANQSKSDFVSFVAHELKNPMTSVKGYADVLASGAVGPINEAQANFLSTIRANIDRMNALVSDLNDMSKIEAGRLHLDLQSFPLAEAVDTAIRSNRRQIEEKHLTLLVDLPERLPNVLADRTRLEQILVNLISNAHKYTAVGGSIEISADCQLCDAESKKQVPMVHLWVKDNGSGISPEDQKKIFQKFFRSDDPKIREVAGTGLGLNITKSLVEMQGGQIWFESECGRGTTFHFTIPSDENPSFA